MNPTHALRNALLEGFNGRPALLAPAEVEKVTSLFMGVMARQDSPSADERARADEACAVAVEQAYGENFPRAGADRKSFLFSNGLAFIPVRGVLVHRNGDSWAGTRGYDDIRREFDAAMADPDVMGIVFDSHTGGGMVYGNFELCEHIRSKREEKPSMTVINAGALSGGYSLASATGKIVSTPSGDAGSIGVLTMHVDVSKALEKFGVNVQLVFAGDHKVDGNMFEPLSDNVRADMQSRIDVMYQKFVSTVAINRGMSEQAVRDTQARVFQADDAIKAGLVDAIAAPQAAVASFRAEVFGSTNNERSDNMSDNKKTDAEIAADLEASKKADQDKIDAAVAADRKRTTDIMDSEEAKGREGLAKHLALNTKMSVEEAKDMLKAAPLAATAAAPAKTNALADAMSANGGGPNIGADGVEGDGPKESAAGGLLDAYVGTTGNKSVLRPGIQK
jgi:signal peptide peptidase SppA